MIDYSPLVRFALLLVRPGMVVVVAPAFGGVYLPNVAKIGLTVLIALGLLPSVQVPATAGDVSLALVVLREVAIGMSLGFAVRAFVGAAEFGGHLAGYQIGFSYGATIDPASGVRNAMLTVLYGLLAVLTFLGINGHHEILRALVASYGRLPIGAGDGIDATLLQAVLHVFALVFDVAARLAAPVVIALLLVELVVGLVSRAAPALSFMVIGYPVRLVIGLAVLALVTTDVPRVLASLLEKAIRLSLETAAAFH